MVARMAQVVTSPRRNVGACGSFNVCSACRVCPVDSATRPYRNKLDGHPQSA